MQQSRGYSKTIRAPDRHDNGGDGQQQPDFDRSSKTMSISDIMSRSRYTYQIKEAATTSLTPVISTSIKLAATRPYPRLRCNSDRAAVPGLVRGGP